MTNRATAPRITDMAKFGYRRIPRKTIAPLPLTPIEDLSTDEQYALATDLNEAFSTGKPGPKTVFRKHRVSEETAIRVLHKWKEYL